MSRTSTRPVPKRSSAKRPAPKRSPAPRPKGATAAADRRPRAPMDARIRQRRMEVRRAGARRRRRVTLTVVVILLVVAGGFAITRSALFAITDVRVEGVARDRVQEVLDTARVAKGQNLLAADLDAAVARTLALPWVRDAMVRREPPSTVVLEVAARRPTAVILAGDDQWVVDPEGVVISRSDGASLPRIEVGDHVVAVPGIGVDDPAALNALALLAVLPEDVGKATRRIQAVGAGTVRLRLALADLDDPTGFRRGTRLWVHMGTAGDVDEQVTVLRALLGQLRQARADVPAAVDVRVPSNPVVVP